MTESIESLARQVVAELNALADPGRADGERRYFKGTINNIGVTLPKIQAVEKRFCRDLAKTWSVDQAMEFCETLLAMRVFEVSLLALGFLGRFAERLGPTEFDRFERWLDDDWCDNWAAVDSLCPHVVGPVLRNNPELGSRVRAWAGSGNRWLRRASAVTLVLLLRKGEFLDLAYEIAAVLISDKSDDLVQKGNGWMLREAGATDPLRLERFLLAHGPDIPRTTLRYSIEKFPPDRRAHLLTATRAPRGE
jgi:3-methyladenine DNA glycosylase AlkD